MKFFKSERVAAAVAVSSSLLSSPSSSQSPIPSSIPSSSPFPMSASVPASSSLASPPPLQSMVAVSSLPKHLDIKNPASIKSVAATIAFGAMSYYSGNVTNTPETIAVLPQPYYWWEAGALWGAMLDYYHYTNDTSYNAVIAQALTSQTGPNFDYMAPLHFGSEGNDDQGFWGFAVMSAAEHNFPMPDPNLPSWLSMSERLWNTMAPRWNSSFCGGGLSWQIFASNPNGLDYKNTVSNGAFFQLSARLARATGNATYTAWATRVWDWSVGVGFIDADYWVHDGADSKDNCTKISDLYFTYGNAIYLYGAAVLANHTSDPAWADRAASLLNAARWFFSPVGNNTSSGIMWEPACEEVGTCNTDMKSFKGYLSRFMWATAKLQPQLVPTIRSLLDPSALAAAKACSGGNNGTVCGQRWYVGGFDGSVGLGQQMCALETVQGLLLDQRPPPFAAGQIKDVRGSFDSGNSNTAPPPAPMPTATKRSENAAPSLVGGALDFRWVLLQGLVVTFVSSLA